MTMIETVPILEATGLSAGYNSTPVIQDITFKIKRGEILALIGPNGGGKSTLLKSLTGQLSPLCGAIRIDGQLKDQTSLKQFAGRSFSYFLQGGLIMPELTVREHLQLTARSPNKLRFLLEMIYSEFPVLRSMNKQKAGNLSGGERQILSFGMLLMQRTTLWFMDEPFAGLSPEMVQFTIEFLERKNKEDNITMILAEHHLQAVAKLSTSIALIKDGLFHFEPKSDKLPGLDQINQIINT